MSIHVNILKKGHIPLIDVNGPVFGYPVSDGVYDLLKVFNVEMEVVRTKEEVENAKKKYYEKENAAKEAKSHSTILNEIPPVDTKTPVITEDTVKIKDHYTDEELSVMTKAQLKAILISKGYEPSKIPFEKSHPLAPKYADTQKQLIEKVKKTELK